MKRALRVPLPLAAAFLMALAAATARAQAPSPIDVELGYRFLDVSGNEDMYRTQIDDRQGFLVRSLSLDTAAFGGPNALFDHVHFVATDLGAGPTGGFRLDLGSAGLYRIRATYSRREYFSALPGFANPFLDSGIIPGQHTLNRTRHMFDADIEILPGGMITPIIGYSRNSYGGPGSTTYHVGADEFRLSQNLGDLDQEVRVGAAFQAGPVTGQVIQGWRKFTSDETLRLAPGEFGGNNTGPVLGVPVNLTSFLRTTTTDINTPTTSAFVTGRFGPVRIVGSYSRAKGTSGTDEQEDLTGNLVSFEISRFFRGLSESGSVRAEATQWTGNVRAEVAIVDGVDLEAGWSKKHRERDGFALISSLFTDTSSFSGFGLGSLLDLLQANTSLETTDTTYEANVVARALGPLSVRGGYAHTDRELRISPDPSEIVVPGGQGGDFDRKIKTYNAGVTYTAFGFTVGADYRGDRADHTVVRADFLDRDRYRVRASWGWKDLVRITANGEQIDDKNRDPGIDRDGRIRQYGGEVEVTPTKPLRVRLAADKYQADNTALIRVPQDFTITTSVHRENGTSYEGGIGLVLPRVILDASYGRFKNDGVFPFTIDRVRARVEVPVTAQFSGAAEWMKDKYSEKSSTSPNLGNYDANRYGVFVRWHL